MEEKEKRREAEAELLRASFMGDIREDVRFMGLSLGDITWIIVLTLTIGALPSALPLSVWVKLGSFLGVFFGSVVGYWLKVPFRLRRLWHYWRQSKQGNGEQLIELLGLEEDGWLYRSGKTPQVIIKVIAPPWQTAGLSQKRSRLSGFESFLRACAREGFSASITTEQVPDYRHEIWDRKRSRPLPSEGLRQLQEQRITLWEELVTQGDAQRSDYTLTLSILEYKLDLRQREDEPVEAKPEELKRFRQLSDFRERLDRVLGMLHQSGHRTTLLSGYSIPELIGRWLDRSAWEKWMQGKGTWELGPETVQDEGTLTLEEPRNEPNPNTPTMGQPIAKSAERTETVLATVENEPVFIPKLNKTIALGKADPLGTDASNQEAEMDTLSQVVAAVLQPKRKRWKWNLLPIVEQVKELPWAGWVKQGKEQWNMLKSKLIAPLAWINRRREESAGEEEHKEVRDHDQSMKREDPQEPVEVAIRQQATVLQKPETTGMSMGWTGVKLITSPVPSGKSFLTANLGAAASLNARRVTIVDLSPDRGCLTVLNPLKQPCEIVGWEQWSTHWADWQCYVPSAYPEPAAVCELIEEAAGDLILVEMPWDYPGKVELLARYPAIVVVDCDYHHWLRLLETGWQGSFILNQSTSVMLPRMLSLLKEQGWTPEAVIPYLPEAAYALFQGRTVALDPATRQMLLNITEGRGAGDEHAETYEAAGQALA